MLPLISNVLPTAPAVSTNNSALNTSLLVTASTGDAAAASRQMTASAVMATGAPAAYFPGTPQQRAPQQVQTQSTDRIARVPVPPPTGDYVEVQQPPAPPPAAIRFSAPVTLGIPLTTQLTAQFLAQQTANTAVEADAPLLREERPLSTSRREPNFGNAKGATAYSFAAARSAIIHAKPDVEPA